MLADCVAFLLVLTKCLCVVEKKYIMAGLVFATADVATQTGCPITTKLALVTYTILSYHPIDLEAFCSHMPLCLGVDLNGQPSLKEWL